MFSGKGSDDSRNDISLTFVDLSLLCVCCMLCLVSCGLCVACKICYHIVVTSRYHCFGTRWITDGIKESIVLVLQIWQLSKGCHSLFGKKLVALKLFC